MAAGRVKFGVDRRCHVLRTRKVHVSLFHGSWLPVVRIDSVRIKSNRKVPQTMFNGAELFLHVASVVNSCLIHVISTQPRSVNPETTTPLLCNWNFLTILYCHDMLTLLTDWTWPIQSAMLLNTILDNKTESKTTPRPESIMTNLLPIRAIFPSLKRGEGWS